MFFYIVVWLALGASINTFSAEALLDHSRSKRLGDLHELLKQREIRVLVAHSRINYEIEEGKQKGLIYDALIELEQSLNKDFVSRKHTKKSTSSKLPVRVTIIPVPYDRLYPELLAGHGDIVAGHMLVTPHAASMVDFTEPFMEHIREVLVTHQSDPLGNDLKAVQGRDVFVRLSGGHYQTLLDINKKLSSQGYRPIKIHAVDEHLSDDELMEMVNARLIPATVTYGFRAELWQQVFPHIRANTHNLLLNQGKIAWAVRKKSPELKKYLDNFVKTHRAGTEWGNIEKKKYFGSPDYARDALDSEGSMRFNQLVNLFRAYAGQYDIDYLLLMAQGYQESRLDHSARSRSGAIGVMQIMPDTGNSLKVGDIHKLEPNIHAGAKYIHTLRKKYFADPHISKADQVYFSFAAYNAGPTKIQKMRKYAKQAGLDPNRWFDNVELVTLQHVGREPVQYVSNISKYYLAYRMYTDNQQSKDANNP